MSQSSSLNLQPASLINLPTDVLHIIFDVLLDMFTDDQAYFWDEEPYCGSRLISLSGSCRYLREQTKPRIFREISNWLSGNSCADLWPQSIWPCIVQVTLRDRSHRHPDPITLSVDLFEALPLIPSLSKVVLRLGTAVPYGLLAALSSAPQLSSLEILHARLDGPLPPLGPPSFPSLRNLVICVWKLTAVVAARDVDAGMECDNVVTMLRCVCDRLTPLTISGDLLSHQFLQIQWPQLRKFGVTEHTPTPYLPVPVLIARMPALRELRILFSADLSRGASELHDPIFNQLPTSLEALHIVAAWDLYIPEDTSPKETQETPLSPVAARTTIQHISHLANLVELTLTLDHFPTATIIENVADAFPCLRILTLEDSKITEDVRDPALVEPLSRLTQLTHLRISLDFWPRDPLYVQIEANRNAARWFLGQLPG
ncbi:hypothetical protein C8R46DRAFT_1058647, partial [Mycena filopes]